MALPLLFLGASALLLLASNESTKHKEPKRISPQNGAIVSCGVFGVLEHTGIWLNGNIVELKGNGLIRTISPQRFLQNRSGSQIYLACNQHDAPLISIAAAAKASELLFQYSEYDLIKNNCHKFVWRCISGEIASLTRFSELNRLLVKQFNCEIFWLPSDI